MARRAPHRLNQRAGRAQEPFFVSIEHGDKRHFRQVQTFAQQIYADERLKVPLAQVAE